jgi:hypothetical protein
MGKLWLGMACAMALVLGGCKDDGGESGNAGTTGAVGGTTGGSIAGTTGGSAGVAGTMTGGAGGVAGTMTGGMGGVAGTMTGGAGAMTGGVDGMTGGVGGMTGGMDAMTGGMDAMTGGMGGGTGEVTDTASCIAAATADGRTGACPECGCMKCLAEVMNCQDDGCQAVVTCGQAAGCSGSACYCGEGVDPINCAIFPGPSGPCINEIETASGLVAAGTCETKTCASALSMLATTDPDNAVQRARALSICTQGQRFAAATAATPEAPEIMGMCETECAAE